ncbi:hypothetical protein [Falsarthrobacter nasiphocae]|uniref:ARB-07466-like C-terminal domain-containing protein n=1 Tax=Falsarthrobacter nasiphocae TaxID=189863 RepID=A0AAE4C6H5_9MICC|nr:hypothetical protein [Falsarthrobacter nasiphocae]MDR6891489.1 hypothetical protein [Falsarthrobacter nasiphocae]
MPTERSRSTRAGRPSRPAQRGRAHGTRASRAPRLSGRAKALITALVGALILAGVGIWAVTARPWGSVVVRETCTAAADGRTHTLTPSQSHYAAQIGAISLKRGLPIRAATIATATAIQESGLANLDYGDDAGPDSRGLFQQRPSQGWGTEAQIMDPEYAINTFYNALVKVSGYQSMDVTTAAQAVQRSAFPDAYADHEPEARAFAAAFRGQTAASLSCTLRPATSPGDASAVLSGLSADLGVTGQSGASSVTVPVSDTQHGWAVAHWAVANASEYGIDSVTYGGRTWTREGSWSQTTTPAAESSGTVSIVLHR